MDSLPQRKWWREPGLFLVMALVLVAYVARIQQIPVRGEEPRRARVAQEMIESGNWLVPTQQGIIFRDRPPLQNWVIALSIQAFGDNHPVAIRFPSLLALLGLTFILYGHGRQFLNQTGATASALAYATAGEMFQMGRQAETESLFAFFLGGALLLWHWGFVKQWPRVITWSVAYTFFAGAALCKGGLQPPVYFGGAVGLYLIAQRKLGELFTLDHLIGLLVGAVWIGAWLFPFAHEVGWHDTKLTWFQLTADRFKEDQWQPAKVLRHLLQFPLELYGSLMPWSLLLIPYLSRSFWKSLHSLKGEVFFHVVAFGIAFLTIWIPTGGQTRYMIPVYPCFAFLVGVVVHQVAGKLAPVSIQKGFTWFVMILAGLFLAIAILLPFSQFIATRLNKPDFAPISGHEWFYALGFFAISAGLFFSRTQRDSYWVRQQILLIAAGTALITSGLMVDSRLRRSENTALLVREATKMIPNNVTLVSIGETDAIFAYYYQKFIPQLPLNASRDDLRVGDYFCYLSFDDKKPELPFEWVELSSVPMDRFKKPHPHAKILICQRTH
ncbi:MAG: glycosyltransferase family 39 protein [Gemmataceae bacterium]|nr:glycosyltransferase family 39 protein [Gemmataceae bacterium]